MAKDGIDSKNNLPATNDNIVTNKDLFSLNQDIKQGRIKSYLLLAEIYEIGCGVKKDFEKAISFREKYIEEYRKTVSAKFDPIAFIIETGNKLFDAGNNIKAGKCYLEACLQLVEKHSGDHKNLNKALKKYKLESLLKKTGCENYL